MATRKLELGNEKNEKKMERRKTENAKYTMLIISACVLGIMLFVLGRSLYLNLKWVRFNSPATVLENDKQRYKKSSREHKNDNVTVRYEKINTRDKSGKKIELISDLAIENKQGSKNNFYSVSKVVADSAGNIYVACESKMGCCIQKYDFKGNYLRTIGSEGKGPGEFLPKFNFDIGPDNLIYVCDYGNQRISKFTLDGDFIETKKLAAAIGQVYYMQVSDNKNIYLTFFDASNNKVIHKYSPSGEHLQSFGFPLFNKTFEIPHQLYYIQETFSDGAICVQSDFILFSRTNPYEICKFTPDGALSMQIFRKNSFFPPAKVITIKELSIHPLPTMSTMIAYYQNMIINCVYVLPEFTRGEFLKLFGSSKPDLQFKEKLDAKYKGKSGTVVDFFSSKGELLYSIHLNELVDFSSMDKKGHLYGRLSNDNGEDIIVRYQLKI